MTQRALLLVTVMAAAGLTGLRVHGGGAAKANAFVLEANAPARLGNAVILCGDVKGTSVSDVLIVMDGKDKGSFSGVVKAKSGTVTYTPGKEAVKLKLKDATMCDADPDQDRNGPGKGLKLFRAGELTLDLPAATSQK